MAANPDNASLSRTLQAKAEGEPRSHEPLPGEGGPGTDYPQDLLQNYNQLSERYRRTTNALAS